ncbi:MAG TPA: hypothetical protein VNW71_03065 [Thermoanaerobaculia bacterium]|nr:hypothetical protein [Thermoanaerobaculia bacterium]
MRAQQPTPLWFALPVLTLFLAGAATAQVPAGRPAGAPSFARAEAAFAAVENVLTQIEKGRKLTESLDPEPAVAACYKELRQAYEPTLKAIAEEAQKAEEARKAGKKMPGPRPDQKLAAWERQAVAFRGRAEKIVSRLTQINMGLRDGSILIVPELLKKMPAEEVQELRQWLTPEAIRRYQAIDKSLFAEGAAELVSPFPPPAVTAAMTMPERCRSCGDLASRPRPRNRSLLDDLGDLLVPDADAAMAAGCVLICGAQPEACPACIFTAIGVTSALAAQIDGALDRCDRFRTRVARGLCTAGVIVLFAAAIA